MDESRDTSGSERRTKVHVDVTGERSACLWELLCGEEDTALQPSCLLTKWVESLRVPQAD